MKLSESIIRSLEEASSRKEWSLDDIDTIIDTLGTSREGFGRFSNIELSKIKDLIKKGYIDLNERQNDGRSIKEILDIAKELKGTEVTVGGYIILPPRSDYRVTIDSVDFDMIDSSTPDPEVVIKEFGEYADEYDYNKEANRISMWWD